MRCTRKIWIPLLLIRHFKARTFIWLKLNPLCGKAQSVLIYCVFKICIFVVVCVRECCKNGTPRTDKRKALHISFRRVLTHTPTTIVTSLCGKMHSCALCLCVRENWGSSGHTQAKHPWQTRHHYQWGFGGDDCVP